MSEEKGRRGALWAPPAERPTVTSPKRTAVRSPLRSVVVLFVLGTALAVVLLLGVNGQLPPLWAIETAVNGICLYVGQMVVGFGVLVLIYRIVESRKRHP